MFICGMCPRGTSEQVPEFIADCDADPLCLTADRRLYAVRCGRGAAERSAASLSWKSLTLMGMQIFYDQIILYREYVRNPVDANVQSVFVSL